MNHIFVVCAYKENPYLEECIKSVVNQTVKSKVLISTATPNAFIQNMAEKYNLKMVVNTEMKDGIDNFNFGYSKAEADYVTICHQDDYYDPDFLKNVMLSRKSAKKPLIFFTDYCEVRGGKIVRSNKLLFVKRIMLFPLRSKFLRRIRWVRNFILKFGSPICCPAVTFNKKLIQGPIFDDGCMAISDWKAWVKLAKLDGEFCYISKKMLYKRIHEGSATSETIQNNMRSTQEKEFFMELWPGWAASIISKIYSKAQKSNK